MSAKVNNEKQQNAYSRLRSRLIAKGTNITRWAADNDFPASTVYDAARGTRTGIVAVRIRKQLEEFANA